MNEYATRLPVEEPEPQPVRAFRSGRGLPTLVGMLLLVAAALKSHEVATGTADTHWTSFALIETELLVGIGLLSGCCSRFWRNASRALFLCFLGFALSKAFAGERSCGCFGEVPLAPWAAVVLDVLVLAGLSVWRPDAGPRPSRLDYAMPTALLLAITPLPLLAWMLRPPVSPLACADIDLGVLDQGDRRAFSWIVRNTSDFAVEVYAFEASCACLRVPSGPIRIAGRGEAPFALELDLSREPTFTGKLSISVNAWDSSGQRVLECRVKATVSRTS
jgi:hypothetical protein